MISSHPEGAGALAVTIAAAVNDHAVLEACLRRSPDVAGDPAAFRIYEGFPSAARAYNRALEEADSDIVVLVHQDVYLPAGFLARLKENLARLAALDPDWAVAGVIGVGEAGGVVGETWSSGLQQLVGEKVAAPTPVVSMDEVLLVVRRAAGVRFDETMPGFHLYAADFVLAARQAGHGAYVIDLPIIHHSRPVVRLDAGYRRAYRFMQRKWRAQLPVPNLVCPIDRSSVPLLVRDARLRWLNRGQRARRAPSEDPASIARGLGIE
jgi:hypothetical protein